MQFSWVWSSDDEHVAVGVLYQGDETRTTLSRKDIIQVGGVFVGQESCQKPRAYFCPVVHVCRVCMYGGGHMIPLSHLGSLTR